MSIQMTIMMPRVYGEPWESRMRALDEKVRVEVTRAIPEAMRVVWGLDQVISSHSDLLYHVIVLRVETSVSSEAQHDLDRWTEKLAHRLWGSDMVDYARATYLMARAAGYHDKIARLYSYASVLDQVVQADIDEGDSLSSLMEGLRTSFDIALTKRESEQ